MSHYDCSDCGASMGIEYGSCESCTPKKVMKLERELIFARSVSAREFDASVEDDKRTFVNEQTKDIQAEYDNAYAAGKPK